MRRDDLVLAIQDRLPPTARAPSPQIRNRVERRCGVSGVAPDPRCPEMNPKSTRDDDRCERPKGHTGDHIGVSHSGRWKIYPSKWTTPAPDPLDRIGTPRYSLEELEAIALRGCWINSEQALALVEVARAARVFLEEHQRQKGAVLGDFDLLVYEEMETRLREALARLDKKAQP